MRRLFEARRQRDITPSLHEYLQAAHASAASAVRG
jgi:hypothetical protein